MILVTGSSGVIGRALISLLDSNNIDFIGVPRETFDLSSDKSLVDYIDCAPSAIVHLAAAVPHSLHYPDNPSSASKTRTIDSSVHQASLYWGCRVVYASTCSLYDKTTKDIKVETTPIQPSFTSCYLNAKSEGEQLFSQLPSHSILRVPAPIGPGLPSTVVAQKFFNCALSGRSINLWGTGRREQNFVDVTDIANMFYLSAFSTSQGLFNISADCPTTMLELAEAMCNINPSSKVVFSGHPDPLENQYTRYSNERAYSVLGWKPTRTLGQSIQSMLSSCDALP